jgi:hypothetical protein
MSSTDKEVRRLTATPQYMFSTARPTADDHELPLWVDSAAERPVSLMRLATISSKRCGLLSPTLLRRRSKWA